MWVATEDLPRSAAHPFYARLNQIPDQHDFDGLVESLCERFYADEGRPGLPPGLLPLAADRLFRRLGRRACDCVACRGFVCAARVSWADIARCTARSLDDFAQADVGRPSRPDLCDTRFIPTIIAPLWTAQVRRHYRSLTIAVRPKSWCTGDITDATAPKRRDETLP
jgi:hypothetical protein